MRTIKFRAISQITGKWCYGLITKIDGIPYLLPEDATRKTKVERVQERSIGQFTGLFDKNGVEIYESDMVKSFRGIGVIESHPDHFYVERMISTDHTKTWLYGRGIHRVLKGNFYEVIGNIHQPAQQ